MARTSRAVIARKLDRIQELIARQPEGISARDLAIEYAAQHEEPIAIRTLNRRLDELVAQGRIATRGASVSRVYRLVPPADAAPAPPAAEEEYVPLSAAGGEVRAMVRRPVMYREPAGYDLDFLSAYEPGATWYLPEGDRQRLHEMGITPDPDRPAGTFARDIFDRLLIDLAWASSRLEGNTYTRLDTQNLIHFGERAEGKDAENAQMILNHKGAIEFLIDNAGTVGWDRRTLTTLHATLSENLLGDPGDEGTLRKRPVQITGTRYTPVAIPRVIEDALDLLLHKAEAIPDPFEQAFFAMVHIPYLQPFADVNKRTSRLAANLPLIRANVCPLSFVDVPERAYMEGTLGVYELKRVELLRDVFLWAYARSCAQYKIVRDSVAQPDPVRLKYRTELAGVVHEVVAGLHPPRREVVWAEARKLGVPGADLDAFGERALALLNALHEGNAGRYSLRPSEWERWRRTYRSITPPGDHR